MQFIKTFRLLACGLAVAMAAPLALAQDKPNILVIWGDDVGLTNISYNSRGMMGYRTPNIDRIGEEGMAFTDYYGEQSCTAGRSAFITGQHPLRTGLLKVGLPGADIGLRQEDPTIAALLKARAALQRANEQLLAQSRTDALTGIANRRHFDEILEREIRRSVRLEDAPLSLILCDIDYFKLYNDRHGHIAGDECLKSVAQTITSVFRRAGDLVARYGGEEFVILLPKTEGAGALELARRISSSIRSFRYKGLGDEEITISAGISTFPGNGLHSFTHLVDQANQLMFRAKSEGKDRIATTDQNIAVNQSQAVS